MLAPQRVNHGNTKVPENNPTIDEMGKLTHITLPCRESLEMAQPLPPSKNFAFLVKVDLTENLAANGKRCTRWGKHQSRGNDVGPLDIWAKCCTGDLVKGIETTKVCFDSHNRPKHENHHT